MPVYNASHYVKDAIDSILNQTFTDFELLIFNDGSTDGSQDIIKAISDKRIVFFDNKENSGYVAHLNTGLRIARGKYIARMDADDIALPERFARQVALLNAEPTVGLCGTRYQMFGTLSTVITLPLGDQEIREFMLQHCPIGHPTVMFRKSVVEQHQLAYDKRFMPAEDYKLWYDFSKVTELRNLPEVLLRYRVHPNQISAYKNDIQRNHANAIRLMQLTDKGFVLSKDEEVAYCAVVAEEMMLANANKLKQIIKMIETVLRQNEQLQAYDAAFLTNFFRAKWLSLLTHTKQYTPSLLPVIVKQSLVNDTVGLSRKIKFIIKSLLFWKSKG